MRALPSSYQLHLTVVKAALLHSSHQYVREPCAAGKAELYTHYALIVLRIDHCNASNRCVEALQGVKIQVSAGVRTECYNVAVSIAIQHLLEASEEQTCRRKRIAVSVGVHSGNCELVGSCKHFPTPRLHLMAMQTCCMVERTVQACIIISVARYLTQLFAWPPALWPADPTIACSCVRYTCAQTCVACIASPPCQWPGSLRNHDPIATTWHCCGAHQVLDPRTCRPIHTSIIALLQCDTACMSRHANCACQSCDAAWRRQQLRSPRRILSTETAL